MASVDRGRLTHQFSEHAIEVGQGLETHFISDLAYPQVAVQQKLLCPLDTKAIHILCEVNPGCAAEQFAEIKPACVHGLRNTIQRQLLLQMFANILLGTCDHGRFHILSLKRDLVSSERKMFCKNREQVARTVELL